MWLDAAFAADPEPTTAAAAPSEPSSEADPVEVALHGDVKTFFVLAAPSQWLGLDDAAVESLGMSEDEAIESLGLKAEPSAQGVASGRLKLTITKDRTTLDVHWALAVQNTGASGVVPGASTGVALTAPEIVPLTWRPDVGDAVALQHRFDRLVLSTKVKRVDLAFGRQPISFGTGRIFTPLDLVNPFHPATIDSEYKPGVDAVRADAYVGATGKLTAAAAYAGEPLVGEDRETDPGLDDLVLAATGQGTVGVSDLRGFLGVVHGEPVAGASIETSVGPVGVHADATFTLADEPFVRAVAGADWRPTTTTTLMGEAYVQTFGAASPDGYLDAVADPRFQRGEVWQMGRYYAAITVAQEVTPLIAANASVIANVADPSALIALGTSWSVADDAVLAAGAYLGAGRRPDTVDFSLADGALVPPDAAALAASVNSEFGLYPVVGYLQVRTYF